MNMFQGNVYAGGSGILLGGRFEYKENYQANMKSYLLVCM